MKPRIAITANVGKPPNAPYMNAIRLAGGEPVMFGPSIEEAKADPRLDSCDGLLLTGGGDVDSALWGELLHPQTKPMDPRRQRHDLQLIAEAEARGMPVLGICLGIQEMAVHRGGRIIQHLPDEPNVTLDHGGADRPATHQVAINADSILGRTVCAGGLLVNSRHHQAVRDAAFWREPGRCLAVVARSPDGVIEAIEDPAPGRFFLGIQWHPEDLLDEPPHRALFQSLCRAAEEWRG